MPTGEPPRSRPWHQRQKLDSSRRSWGSACGARGRRRNRRRRGRAPPRRRGTWWDCCETPRWGPGCRQCTPWETARVRCPSGRRGRTPAPPPVERGRTTTVHGGAGASPGGGRDRNGDYRVSIGIFLQMGRAGIGSDRTTFAVLLKACSDLENYDLGIQIHGFAVCMGFDQDVVTGSAIVDMYAKCKKLGQSLRFFREMTERNWVSWSAVIAGCVQNEELVGGLGLFKEMQKEGVGVSQSTYASVFRSSAGLSAVRLGSQLHAHSLKADFGSDIIVGTATVDMYAKCDRLPDARKLFKSLPIHNLQSYNAIIVGYARSYQGFEAFQMFRVLLKSGIGFDEISLSGAFSACAVMKGHLEGIQVHGLAIKSTFVSNVCVANAILDMYGKCGALMEAHCVFDEMERTDAVSWNAIIAASEQNGNEEETLSLFVWMLRSRMEPDDFTYGSVLKACAGRQALNCGMEVHGRVIKSGMGFDWFVGSAIVDMYCKCSNVGEAEKLHDKMEEQTMVSWNAMISGFSSNEQSEEAQKFFSRMLEMGVKPDSFTYATVLDTCANLATVGLGKQIHAQIIKHELQSDVFISSTLVDMYSKCGNMQDSRLMFEKAPKRDFVTWNTLICGYAQHGLGEEALKVFDGMWDEVSKLRKMMRCSGLKKEPGCSWVEVKSELHMFLVGDKAHPRCEEIYENLDLLIIDMKWAGYVPDSDFVLEDEGTEFEELEELMSCN
ncbi:pentatricopeptide repeat (PPR) superfamily protein [Actinidia rufa]|uniref:Pentatricopeptide repeat (PPR) superfamily protein n=1 Tax=Actinidia rufa TaxID=165716 RepID=A0A7J0H7T7_9ERIC|nr:pentatricopeptide repeat (PPR) superfamily protein [Actinidia rufa]